MPSTDIDGSPILILTLEEGRKLKAIFDYFDIYADEDMDSLAIKVDKFLDAVNSGK